MSYIAVKKIFVFSFKFFVDVECFFGIVGSLLTDCIVEFDCEFEGFYFEFLFVAVDHD